MKKLDFTSYKNRIGDRVEYAKKNPMPENVVCKHGNITGTWYLYDMGGRYTWRRQEDACKKCGLEAHRSARTKIVDSILRLPKRFASAPRTSRYFGMYEQGCGLIFTGGVGTGKTYEAVSLLKNIYIEHEIIVRFQTATDITTRLKTSIKRGNYDVVLSEYKNEKVLFIDDVGVENASDFMKECLYIIINHRYNEMLPMIITTNLTAENLSILYGQRIISRLVEMVSVVKLDGKDRRLSNRKSA